MVVKLHFFFQLMPASAGNFAAIFAESPIFLRHISSTKGDRPCQSQSQNFKVKKDSFSGSFSAMASFKFPTDILLSLSTAPVLLILIGSKALIELASELGEASEEVFRGDRLPILKIAPNPDPPSLNEN